MGRLAGAGSWTGKGCWKVVMEINVQSERLEHTRERSF